MCQSLEGKTCLWATNLFPALPSLTLASPSSPLLVLEQLRSLFYMFNYSIVCNSWRGGWNFVPQFFSWVLFKEVCVLVCIVILSSEVDRVLSVGVLKPSIYLLLIINFLY